MARGRGGHARPLPGALDQEAVQLVHDVGSVNIGRYASCRISSPAVSQTWRRGTRWLLLRNGENVTPADRVRLGNLLAANRRLAAVYVLKDDLKHLWDYTYPGAATRFFEVDLPTSTRRPACLSQTAAAMDSSSCLSTAWSSATKPKLSTRNCSGI